ncbi:MAG: DUF4136 domain-containing protein [Oceanihabitans sp.]
MKPFITLILFFILSSCAPIYVTQDFEKGTDFSKYKSYNFYSDQDTGLSELDTKRIIKTLDIKLQSLGLTKHENPDFYIAIKSTEYEEEQRSTVGVGVGGTGRNIGGGVSIGIPVGNTKITRQILFDFIDENGIGLFWQANSESSFNPNTTPEKREQNLILLVEKVFSKYPPKQ